MYINTQNELNNLTQILLFEKEIGLDTEFVRENTYYPILSLIQISTCSNVWAIDALSGLNFEGIANILSDNDILKVIHCPVQDIEVLYRYLGIRIKNIFDTQLAAQFIGYKDPPSYEKLVSEYFNVKISKLYQYSNWIHRPLIQDQISYALTDVKYLIELKDKLTKQLINIDNYTWFLEECDKYNQNKNYDVNIIDILSKFLNDSNDINLLVRIYKILYLRDAQAKLLNTPTNTLLAESKILAIVKCNNLYNITCTKLKFENSEPDWQKMKFSVHSKIKQMIENNTHKPTINYILMRKLKTLLEKTAKTSKISVSLIANRNDLMNLTCKPEKSKVSSGWRNEIFGKIALETIDSLNSKKCTLNQL